MASIASESLLLSAIWMRIVSISSSAGWSRYSGLLGVGSVSSVIVSSLWMLPLSSFGFQDWCKAAPQKLQLQLALLLTTADGAGTDCVFGGAMKQEITGMFSAVSFKKNI